GIVQARVERMDGPGVRELRGIGDDVVARNGAVDEIRRAADRHDDGRRRQDLDAGLVLLARGAGRLRAVRVVLARPREGRRAVRLREAGLVLSACLTEERVAVRVPGASLIRGARAVLEVEHGLL